MKEEAGILKGLVVFHIGLLIFSISILALIFVSRLAGFGIPVGAFLMLEGYRIAKQ